MNIKTFIILTGFLFLGACGINQTESNPFLFSKENLVAWCIVPFDKMTRTPEQRARMLSDLGIKHFAYDWRTEHLTSFPDEIAVLRDHEINLSAVWFWVDDPDNIINENNERLLKILEEQKVRTELWVSFSENYFETINEEDKLNKAVFAVRNISDWAENIGCTVALYNHGGWFGEPENQVDIIRALPDNQVGIVYNFHHGHAQVRQFRRLLKTMLPYLSTVNINGMKVQGPKILPIGEGDSEYEMLRNLKKSGFSGNIGILGHVEDEDVKLVLEQNLSGLQSILEQMGDEEALATY